MRLSADTLFCGAAFALQQCGFLLEDATVMMERHRWATAIINLIPPGARQFGPAFLQIRAVNTGSREAKVNGIMWKLGVMKPERFVVIPSLKYSSVCPIKREHGDEATYMFPVESFPGDSESVLTRLRGRRFPHLVARGLHAGVYLSTGHEFVRRPDKRVRDWMVLLANDPDGAAKLLELH